MLEIIKKIEDIFCQFNEKDYTKIFIKLEDCESLILLCVIDKKARELIETYFQDFFDFNNNQLYLKSAYNTPHKITEVFTHIAKTLQQHKVLKIREENILLQTTDGKYNLGYVDRSLLHVFGLLAHGVHLNAYVEKTNPQGSIAKYLWIARRAKTKLHDPLKLDNLVAGAVSLGFSPSETLIKEAGEEAGITEVVSEKAISKQIISYKVNKYGGVRNDIVHIFELKLPEDFKPIAVDGEVEEFILLDCHQVLNLLIENFDSFKYNSAITILFFLYSHNFIKDIELNNFLKTFFTKLSYN
ncbi:MAG: NUDIX domain-containing protein [Alphaproteobacteria bacterium]|jgi:isopentenyldiphosphate isomerase|nr:NUDIX domain-containing protein [Alphaproteobacteria bacterium]